MTRSFTRRRFLRTSAAAAAALGLPAVWPGRILGSNEKLGIAGIGVGGMNDLPHHLEWIAAAKGGPKPASSFDHSGPMTEAVLLGNIALRAGKRIEWDAAKLEVKNAPEAARHVRREYRKGWSL